jgi:hypothetical protein
MASKTMPPRPRLNLGLRRVHDGPLLDHSAVPWCAAEPHRRPSVIFPTVVDMRWALAGRADAGSARALPLDRFHLYYAPHRSAGVGLATAPRPEGPWTPYSGNPILRLTAFPGINDHLSSPEIVVRPDVPEAPFWLYVHGRTGPRAQGFGQHTCVATSPDAVTWQPRAPQPVLTATAEQSGHTNSAAYARIFQRGSWLYALYKAEQVHSLARSRDGIAWEHWPRNPLLVPDPAAGEHAVIRHTGLLVRRDTLVIFYSAVPGPDGGPEEIEVATFGIAGDDWRDWGPLRRRGTAFGPALEWEANDVRDPYPLLHEDTLYLYYVGGHEHGVGLATAPAGALAHLDH